jgi:O-acetylhomoserine (thiol)-lyase
MPWRCQILSKHPAVAWVNYPGLENNPNHKNAAKYLKGQYGGLWFLYKAGLEPAKKFIQSSKLLSPWPTSAMPRAGYTSASTTHQQLTVEEQKEPRHPRLHRLSIG